MNRPLNTEFVLAIIVFALSVLSIFVWIPYDVESGFFEKVRRQKFIGDSLAPTIAATIVLIAGVLIALEALRVKAVSRLDKSSLKFVLQAFLIVSLSLIMMRFSGATVVEVTNLISGEETDYRSLRDSRPWKYIGYVSGGTFMVTGLVSMLEGRISWRAVIIGLITCTAFIGIYDLPFDDLLLPPNGDY